MVSNAEEWGPSMFKWTLGTNLLERISNEIRGLMMNYQRPAHIQLGVPDSVERDAVPVQVFGLPVYIHPALEPGEFLVVPQLPHELLPALPPSILTDAQERVEGNARDDYGPPADNAERIAVMWNALGYVRYGERWCSINGADVCAFMRGLKEAREANLHKRDNLVDIAGWAAVEDEVKR